MLVGEAQELFFERARALGPDRSKKSYKFQVCEDNGLDHFRSLSCSHPTLCFVLVYGYDDPLVPAANNGSSEEIVGRIGFG